jgi:glycosyltransferase involved in cell wall biosynthesis
VTILIPTKNEEITIATFLDWVYEGFDKSEIKGEIILADSSSDKTPQIATSKGAKVISIHGKGLGNAYKEAVKYVNGKYVIVGDADCTYDFRHIEPFLSELRKGNEFVMGNRFKGTIEKGSMPLHHRYFGTPLTSWILQKFLKLPFSDIHCGMRGLTSNLLRKLPFNEPGWEYAPEMIIHACKNTKRVSEVPINFLKEPTGRVSHFKRGRFSFAAPFKAGLGAIRVTLMYSLDSVLIKIGKILTVLGSTITLLLTNGKIEIYSIKFSVLTQIIGFSIGIAGWTMKEFGHLIYKTYSKEFFIEKLHKKIIRLFLSSSFVLTALLVFTIVTVLKLAGGEISIISSQIRGSYVSTLYILCLLTTSLLIALFENYLSHPSNLTSQRDQ